MLRNYFKMAVRIIMKNKIFSAVNIIGFAIGLASCLLILFYVHNELSYETMHKNRDHIYRIPVNLTQGDNKIPFAASMPSLAPALKEEFPEVLETVRVRQVQQGKQLEYNNKKFLEDNIVYTEQSFFDIFSFQLLQGDTQHALYEPYTMVISKKMAHKYFGNEYPIGKTLTDEDGTVYTITGVLEPPKSNTQLDFDFLISYPTILAQGQYIDHWGQFGSDHTFALMNESFSEDGFNDKLQELVKKNNNPAMASIISLELQPFKNIYFHSHMNGELSPQGNIQQVYLFSVIAFLIMLIACLNFMNLSTARSSQRMQEVGMRKIFGSDRSNLIRQFLSESILLAITSMILALIIFALFYPALNNFIGKDLSVNYLTKPITLFILLILAVIVGTIAGLYPAFVMSRFKPLAALRARVGKKRTLFRKVMVITQFTIAIVLIIITAFVFKQLHFMRNQDLGFSKDNVLLLDLPQGCTEEKNDLIRQELKSIPGINDVSICFAAPCVGGAMVVNAVSSSDETGDPNNGLMINVLPCDYNYIPLFDLHLVDGRNFSEEFPSDKENAVILNEAAVKKLGLSDPIGADLGLPLFQEQEKNSQVIGVLKDFHYRSLRNDITPVALVLNSSYASTIAIKYDPKELSETLSALNTEWKTLFPDTQFNYTFLEDEYNKLYQSEEKTGKLFSVFSLLIIFVACLGIFGLASFLCEQRTREIGIRKVLGSSSTGVVALLTKDFTKWVLYATLIAIPIAWYASDKWLEKFAYRTTLSFWIFILAGCIALAISFITISVQTFRAANLDPVQTIKYE